MPLISIMLTLVVVGVLLGLINRYIPMASSIKKILNLVVVIFVIYWVLSIFGLTSAVDDLFHSIINAFGGSVNPDATQPVKA